MNKKILMVLLVVITLSMFTSTAFAGYNSSGTRENCNNCLVQYGYIMTAETLCWGSLGFEGNSSHSYGFLWLKTCDTSWYETAANPVSIILYCPCGWRNNSYSSTSHTEYATHYDCGLGNDPWCNCVYNQIP